MICILGGLLILVLGTEVYLFLFPEEDMYSDRAIQKAKEKKYPPLSNLTYKQIMEYKAKERIAILGVNSFKELYEKYPLFNNAFAGLASILSAIISSDT